MGLSSIKPSEIKSIIFSNKGAIAEQFVGQQLRSAQSPLHNPQLFYWQRIGGRLGEIDYIIHHQDRVIPVEVKSGTAGSMKSLHQFMFDKNLNFAVRFNQNLPQNLQLTERIQVKTTSGDSVNYQLLSLPIYLAERIEELLIQVL